jgi:hypothetical protein
MRYALVVTLMACGSASLFGQQNDMMAQMNANPISATARMMFDIHSKDMIAAAELMPEAKYAFHPTAPQMTFGKLIAHIAQTNEFLCANIGGTPMLAPPTEPKDTASKDVLVAALTYSFAHCAAALKDLTDAKATGMIEMGPQKVPRVYMLMVLISDWSDHYSTEASYLRLNGLVPPSAQGPAAAR